jgi:integral membrane protein
MYQRSAFKSNNYFCKMKNTKLIKTLRIVAIAEGVSYLALALTMPLKYALNILWPNKIVGMAHGILFIVYLIFVVLAAIRFNWSKINMFWSFLASVLPFGTFVADAKIFRKYT